MDFDRVMAAAASCGAGRYREALRRAAYAGATYDAAGVPAELAERLEREAPRLSVTPRAVAASADGSAVKARLALRDGREIESVLLRPSAARRTVCLSSQAGCAMACSFCATGLSGLARDLTAEEIWDQVLFWRARLAESGGKGAPMNLVFMGMGEPLANYDALARALRELTAPRGFGLAPSRVAVSTAGVAPAIERFAEEFAGFPLAVSLHAATDPLRDRLVPLNRAYPLERLAAALRAYLARSRRKLLVEYVLLKDANDRAEDAEALASYLSGLGPRERLHVNLIDFNPTATSHAPASEARARAFHEALRAAGFAATRRRNRGRDVAGACGQLAAHAA
ncbi:MAG: 23S rRNA (adenine(2503)-C(2))-methyltransferase RlmN [Elusimicrobia bacterium]|nr:23S rRNA (adenine(2503)-C(2))-methyltransferase RlmN [Elusimicrobiota bacterium]